MNLRVRRAMQAPREVSGRGGSSRRCRAGEHGVGYTSPGVRHNPEVSRAPPVPLRTSIQSPISPQHIARAVKQREVPRTKTPRHTRYASSLQVTGRAESVDAEQTELHDVPPVTIVFCLVRAPVLVAGDSRAASKTPSGTRRARSSLPDMR